MPAHPTRLANYLAATYLGLVIYATLYPLSGWRDSGVAPFDFLVMEWPRYWTASDLIVNVLAYLPLGFLLTMLFVGRIHAGLAALLVTLLTGGLSLGLETLQNWLPSRVPAMLDLASNTLGGLFGALLGWHSGQRWLQALGHWQHRHLNGIPRAELGLMLLLLWLACQLFPAAVPLGVGDVRYLLGIASNQLFDPQRFQAMATAVITGNLLATGLLLSLLIARPVPRYFWVLTLLLSAALLRTVGQWWPSGQTPEAFLSWLTPPFQQAGAIAGSLLLLTLILPGNVRAILAGLALLIATVLINLTPGDPYSRLASVTGLPTLFFNIQNLSHGLAALWPFLCLPYLLFVSRRA